MTVAVEVAGTDHMPARRHSSRIGDQVRAGDLAIVPDRNRTIVVSSENVVVTIAVEVTGTDDMPVRGDNAGIRNHVG